jgi:hypothetical protein
MEASKANGLEKIRVNQGSIRLTIKSQALKAEKF